jgi:hypothetical protein
MLRVASFDIGNKNLGIYVQDTDLQALQKLRKKYLSLPKFKQRRTKGKMTKEIESIHKQLYIAGKRVHTGVYNIREDKEKNEYNMACRKNVVLLLASFSIIWDKCDVILVEKQFFRPRIGKGRKNGSQANIIAIKIAETVMGWFIDNYLNIVVFDFFSTYKTQILGAPDGLTKPQRKRWSVEKCREVHEIRKDEEIVEIFLLCDRIFRKRLTTREKIDFYIDSFPGVQEDTKRLAVQIVEERQKSDDWCDSCTQLQAFLYAYYIACFLNES